MSRVLQGLLAIVVALVPSVVLAQGLLVDVDPAHRYRLPRPPIHPHWHPHPMPLPRPVPEPPQSYKIQELAVNATLVDQVAKVQVSQSFVNTGSRQMEVAFIFPLPYDGAVDQMTFMVDGREYEAKLLSAEEARRIYEGHIRRNQDPALLEWLGTGMFKTSVFPVPPGAKRTVTMRYSQICRKTDGVTEWLFPLSTAKYTSHPVETVKVEVTVQSQASIKNIYSPSHSIELKRPTDSTARITFNATNQVPTSDFRLMYDVGNERVGASVLSYRSNTSDEGYFLLLVSPDIQQAAAAPVPKTVVFVVDRSGSMSGKKIEQAKGALKFVLNNLGEADLFNIIAYDSTVESFRPELQRYSDQTRNEALAFIEGIYAGGSTNIDGALQTALTQLQDSSRPNYVVFLTDGLPTAGERREPQIVAQARAANKVRARVFAFGVGYDVNSRLLDKLARQCFGHSQYVLPNEDIEAHVAKLYGRIGAPAMVDLKVTFDLENAPSEQGSPVSRIYPRDTIDLFSGDQLVLVGRYKQPGDAKVTISGKVGGTEQTFSFPAKLNDKSTDDSHAFIAKLWAVRRVGEIIDEIDLHGKNQELVNELVALATQHGILTPYTSFLADEDANIRDVASNQVRTGLALEDLSRESGEFAFRQRINKRNLQTTNQAPQDGYALDMALPAGMGGMPGAAPMEARGRFAGRGAMPSGGGSPAAASASASTAPAMAGQPGLPEDATVVTTVLNVGTKTFFRRNDRWEDSVLTDEQLRSVKRIERYSDEYFALSRQHGKEVAKYLALEGNVVIVLGDQAYEF
ncbi:MAG: VIT domain-containing protein [Pirellulaceae bacterium]